MLKVVSGLIELVSIKSKIAKMKLVRLRPDLLGQAKIKCHSMHQTIGLTLVDRPLIIFSDLTH